MDKAAPACARCGFKTSERICMDQGGRSPENCPTINHAEVFRKAMQEFHKPENLEFARQASIQEAEGYGGKDEGYDPVRPIKPRVEETLQCAGRMNYKRLGLAFCIGLHKEARVVEKLFSQRGFEVVSALCKAGCNPKEEIGLGDHQKINVGEFETMCNPIAQAFLLNASDTQFNIVMGLCVGHDSLFLKYADAPCTVLVAKDRVLGHNPVAAIYNIDSYYSSLRL